VLLRVLLRQLWPRKLANLRPTGRPARHRQPVLALQQQQQQQAAKTARQTGGRRLLASQSERSLGACVLCQFYRAGNNRERQEREEEKSQTGKKPQFDCHKSILSLFFLLRLPHFVQPTIANCLWAIIAVCYFASLPSSWQSTFRTLLPPLRKLALNEPTINVKLVAKEEGEKDELREREREREPN